MSSKSKYILTSVLDFIFTYGGSTLVIGINYITENNFKYKLTITGIMMLVALVFTAKHLFEKGYRNKMDNLLQLLAATSNEDEKIEINNQIETLKKKRAIYDRIVIMLPFMILYIIAYMGEKELHTLKYTTGILLTTLGVGGVFNVMKQPLYDEYKKDKIKNKLLKNK